MRTAIGFALITITPAKEGKVYNKLSKISKITELHSLFGEYDIIAKIEADDPDDIGNIVVNEIRQIKGIVDTKTLTGTKF